MGRKVMYWLGAGAVAAAGAWVVWLSWRTSPAADAQTVTDRVRVLVGVAHQEGGLLVGFGAELVDRDPAVGRQEILQFLLVRGPDGLEALATESANALTSQLKLVAREPVGADTQETYERK